LDSAAAAGSFKLLIVISKVASIHGFQADDPSKAEVYAAEADLGVTEGNNKILTFICTSFDKRDCIGLLFRRFHLFCSRYLSRNPLFVDNFIRRHPSGARWRYLPERLGDWKSTYIRCSRWMDKGLTESIFWLIARQYWLG
jgi:hypothetical protein